MVTWKMFVRSVSAVALLTAGGFAAGQELPFSHVSRGTSPPVVVEETPTEEEAPDVDPAAEVDEDTTTTTTGPEAETRDTETPDTDAPDVEVTEDDGPPVIDAPAEKKAKPAPAPETRTKGKKDCQVTHPWKGDHNDDGHCDQGWHNKDADWVANRGERPEAADAAKNAEKGDHNDDGHADNGRADNVGDAAGSRDNGDRPETAPGQVMKAERHGEDRR